MFLSCFYFCSLFFCWFYINSSPLFCQYFLLIYFIFYYFQNIVTSKLKDQKPDAVSLTKRRPQAFAKFNPRLFWPTAGRSCSLRNSTESSFQKSRTKDSAVFAFRKVQRSIFPIFFLLFLISYLQSSSASASISFTFSSFTADITFTLFSVQVIFLLFSNMPFITFDRVWA